MSGLFYPINIPGYGYIQDEAAWNLFKENYQHMVKRIDQLNGDNQRMYNLLPIDLVVVQNKGACLEEFASLYPNMIRLTVIDFSELEAMEQDRQPDDDGALVITQGNWNVTQIKTSLSHFILNSLSAESFENVIFMEDE